MNKWLTFNHILYMYNDNVCKLNVLWCILYQYVVVCQMIQVDQGTVLSGYAKVWEIWPIDIATK